MSTAEIILALAFAAVTVVCWASAEHNLLDHKSAEAQQVDRRSS